jgi:hypothetical protein
MDFKKTIVMTITVTNKTAFERFLSQVEENLRNEENELVIDKVGTVATYVVQEDQDGN